MSAVAYRIVETGKDVQGRIFEVGGFEAELSMLCEKLWV